MAVLILTALVLGTPVFVAMAALALFFFFREGLPVTAVTAEVYRLISSPTLPAIPLLQIEPRRREKMVRVATNLHAMQQMHAQPKRRRDRQKPHQKSNIQAPLHLAPTS